MDFKNKVVIVTGASSGIGETTALLCAQLSANLVLVGRNEEKLKEVSKKCEETKQVKTLVMKADLCVDSEVKNIIEMTINKFGRIDVLVNNAGAGAVAGLTDGINNFDHMISTNLRSVYLLTSLAAPHLIKTKGNVVNVSSIAAMKAIADFIPYCVSKAGLDMFTKCVAKKLAADKVRVNSVNPGPVLSDFHNRLGLDKATIDEMMLEREKMSPLGKIATNEEVAKLIIYLASDVASSITGSIFVIDNGYMLS